MTGLFGIVGPVTRDLLTYQGRPIVHDSREEFEWLLPGVRVVAVTAGDLSRRSPFPPLALRDHPSVAHLTWPLDRSDFRTGRGGSGPPSGRTKIWSSASPNGPT